MQHKLGYKIDCQECDTQYEVWIRDDDLVPDCCGFCGAGLMTPDILPAEQYDEDE